MAFWVWRTGWVNPGRRNCELGSGTTTEWCLQDMLYDNRSSEEERRSRELELLQNTLSEVDTGYTWQQIRKLIQDCVFPRCEKFGTWSSKGERVDQVLNSEVCTQKEESSVLGPQGARKRGLSPEQESTTFEPHHIFSAWSSKRVKGE